MISWVTRELCQGQEKMKGKEGSTERRDRVPNSCESPPTPLPFHSSSIVTFSAAKECMRARTPHTLARIGDGACTKRPCCTHERKRLDGQGERSGIRGHSQTGRRKGEEANGGRAAGERRGGEGEEEKEGGGGEVCICLLAFGLLGLLSLFGLLI